MEKRTGYGIIAYQSLNIGDEIQSVAAMRFLPSALDAYVFRERPDMYTIPDGSDFDRIKLIMNAWWMWSYDHFPPPPCVDPLLISMHIRPAIPITPKMRDYFLEHGPVGCRDTATLNRLQSLDIPSYFSGCLTLTLEKKPGLEREDFILAIDVPASVVAKIRERTKRPVFTLTQVLNPFYYSKERFNVAKVFLYLFQQAHCVITKRLHVAMPCLALGTPVLVFDQNSIGSWRFDGLTHLFHRTTIRQFLDDPSVYNLDEPPPNPEDYLPIKKDLINRCKAFTGINTKKTMINLRNPLIYMANAARNNLAKRRRVLWWIDQDDIEEHLYQRRREKKHKYDLEV